MSENKDFIEITPSTLVIALLSIALIVLLVFANPFATDEEDDEDTSVDRNNQIADDVEEGPFSDPSITAASATIEWDEAVYIGDLDGANLAVLDFTDFQCPFCQRHAEEVLPSILDNYVEGGDVVYVFNDMPIYPPGSTKLAMAGLCIWESAGIEEFMDYRSLAYDLEFTDDDSIFDELGDLNIDIAAVRSCYEDEKYASHLDANVELGQSAGISGVPGFIVGTISDDGVVDGYMIPGAYPFDMFSEVLDYLAN